MQQRSTHLFTIRFVHQENFTPYLNAGCLPLRPSPPGETSQRLVVISNPVHCFLQVGTKEVAGVLITLWFYAFNSALPSPQCWSSAASIREVSYRVANISQLQSQDFTGDPLVHMAVAALYFVKITLTRSLSIPRASSQCPVQLISGWYMGAMSSSTIPLGKGTSAGAIPYCTCTAA